MNKISEAKIPNIREEILSSPKFLANVQIAMRAMSQEHVDAVNTHLDLISDPGEFEDLVCKHRAESKSKVDTNKMNSHIIGPMIALIERINKMSIEQKTLMDRTSNLVYKLEAKIEQNGKDLNESINTKIEQELNNLLEDSEELKSKVQKAIKSLLESEYFT